MSAVVGQLERDAAALDVASDDSELLVGLVQGFTACKRLSEVLVHQLIPAIDADEFSVGSIVRMAHDDLLQRARGAHTDLERHTSVKSRPRTPYLHAV